MMLLCCGGGVSTKAGGRDWKLLWAASPVSPTPRTALLPPWALSACLPVLAEASVTRDLGPGQEGATAGRLLNSMGRALQAKTQQVVPGGVSLFSDADVGRRCDK